VENVKDFPRIIREAFHIASSGRPGPVLVDIPVNVQSAECEFVWPEKVDIRSYKPTYRGHPRQIKLASGLINKSKCPILYVGGGAIISNCSGEIKKLAEKAEIPLTWTLMAAGIIPTDNPLSLGMLGMHGTYYANHAVQNCDLLIAVGARFDDRVAGNIVTFAPHAKIIHIDIDPTSISKNVRVDVPIVGDARGILKELLKDVKNTKHSEWLKRINTWRKEGPLGYPKDSKLRPEYVVEKIAEITKGDAIITTEVGQNQMWAVQFGKFLKPRTFLSSGGLGTMGYGFPAAIGAQVGQPDKVVFDIAGDGSIQMNIQELATAVKNKIPVKIAILNNSYLGMVRQWQQMFYKKRYSETSLEGNPDFVRIAEAYGATGIRITKKSEVEPAIKKALKIKGPVILDFIVEQEENVFPMVPSGKALDEIVRGLA
jgi:acetolactate synthase-1/2/3 large subunit